MATPLVRQITDKAPPREAYRKRWAVAASVRRYRVLLGYLYRYRKSLSSIGSKKYPFTQSRIGSREVGW